MSLFVCWCFLVVRFWLPTASSSFIPSAFFKQIEIEELRERNHQIARSIFNELEKVALIGRDWAKWDDSYEFIEDVNKEYIRSNLTESTLEDLDLFSMQYLGVDFKDRYHLVRNEDLSLFSLLSKQVLAKKEILLDTAGGEGKLLYDEEKNIFFWVVVQMVTDSREMKTANGYLVMIKLIDPTFFSENQHNYRCADQNRLGS